MKNTPRILIIEDNSDDETLLLRQLKKAELDDKVKVIRDGDRALKFLRDPRLECEKLAAIFLDLKLPKIGGRKILEALRSDDRLREIPVVVMSSQATPEELEECRQLGISCYVEKPLTFASFAKAFADTFHAKREGVLQNCN